MPQIETWSRLPPAIRSHLVERMHDRNISIEDLNQLRLWIESKPNVPDQKSPFSDSMKFRCSIIIALRGRDPTEVADAIPDDWTESPSRTGLGRRFADPRRPGDQIRIMRGNPADPDPVKRGPYVRVSKTGKVSDPIPLQGNPILSGATS